jgi:hypothetical protein
MSLKELYDQNLMSERAHNVTKANKLFTVSDLHQYFYKNKTFTDLQTCGNKLSKELIDILGNYGGSLREIDLVDRDPIENIILNLTRTQREVINSYILVNTNKLNVRSKNAISGILDGNFKVNNFSKNIFLSFTFDVKNLPNVGAKSIPELQIYISLTYDFVLEVSKLVDEKDLKVLNNQLLLEHTFPTLQVPAEVLGSQSIFSIINFLLDHDALFDKTQTTIVKNVFNLYRNQKPLPFEEVAVKVNLTRERVRQIKVACLDQFFGQLTVIQSFNDDLYQNYFIDINSNLIEVDSDTVDIINNTSKTIFTKEFIIYTLYVYLSDSFSLIGNIEDVLQPKGFNARKRHNWNNFYLVKKKIAAEIDFEALVNDIDDRIHERIDESYSFNFRSYLSKFLLKNNIEILDLVFPIAENVVYDEFELHLNVDDDITFERSTKKQVHEYAFEALEELGNPSKIDLILEKVLSLHPNYNTDAASLRAAMARKNGFVPIGRKSVFGLKKWENELANFKGGTIRTITEEFLLSFDEPQHKNAIEDYVKQFRPKTNANSIYNNLYVDESNTFLFYEKCYIGLKSKKYSEHFKLLSKTRAPTKHTWEESLEVLQKFMKAENRLPYSSGCPESEEKLYRWFNIQKQKSYKGKLEIERCKFILEIDEKYSHAGGKRKSKSVDSYEELISFVKTNSRLPSANKSGERNLYKFFYKQRKLFDKNKLQAKEEIQFIEVAKLLQKY